MALAERLETGDPILLNLTDYSFSGSSIIKWRDEGPVNTVSRLLTHLGFTPYLGGDAVLNPAAYTSIELFAVPLHDSRYNLENTEDFIARLNASGKEWGARAQVSSPDDKPLRFRASYKPLMGLFRRTPIFVERMPLDHFRQYAETREILTPFQFILDNQLNIHDLADSP